MSVTSVHHPIDSPLIQNNLFSLNIQHNKHTTLILMTLFTPIVNTAEIPQTLQLLETLLPSVLKTRCFNDKDLPFDQEVTQTEIGHLFEHILLEYLCIYKLQSGCNCAKFKGFTDWNWQLNPWGTFSITINCGYRDLRIFAQALDKSIALTQLILSHNLYPTFQTSRRNLVSQ